MTTSALQSASPLAADGAAMSRILHRAGLSKASVVGVTGPAGNTAIPWLYRHGYEQAAYVHAQWVTCMVGAEALLIPHTCGARELAKLLQDGSCLREGGVLIVQTAQDASGHAGDDVVGVLEQRGYTLDQRLCDRGRDVCIARRRGDDAGFKKAA
jgi:hypothetical protein